jgi:hypothetical protein
MNDLMTLFAMSQEEAARQSDKFGVTTDLPKYVEGDAGPWTLVHKKVPMIRGYFNGMVVVDAPVPVLIRDGVVWMSLTPMEIESHLVHAALARGHVVVCGLGLGYIVYKMLQNPKVKSITVVEECTDLIANFKSLVDGDWADDPKVTIVNSDAFTYVPPHTIDYLYVDISETLMDSAVLRYTQAIQRNVKAKEVGFWGQELELIDLARVRGMQYAMIDERLLSVAQDEWGLPLAVFSHERLTHGIDQEDYVILCKQAVENANQY